MTSEIYISLLRYLTTTAGTFFVFQLLLAILNYKKLNDRHILWHVFMCLTTTLYCSLFIFNSHIVDVKISNILLGTTWGFAFIAYFFYLKSLESYFNEKIKLLSCMKVYCSVYFIMQLLSSLMYCLFDYNFFFNINDRIGESLFYQAMSITATPNIVGELSGIIGVIGFLYTSVVIWLYINKHKRNELFLKCGIIVSLLVCFNDSAIGLTMAGGILPLFFFGNVFESIRFNIYYSKLSIEKILSLENEVINLSKAAQFGFAAASIAHDIKNHIFVIDITTSKLLKNMDTKDLSFKPISRVALHNSKILEITNLYMNAFRDNFSSDQKEISIRQIINDSVELVEEKIKQNEIDLIIDIDCDFKIECNQAELTMSVVNLLRNAIDAITDKFVAGERWIKVVGCSTGPSLEIIDCGSGIESKIANSIFEFGFSTKTKEGGNGVGLAITQQLLSRSGFDLALVSDSSNTAFKISF